MIYDGLQWLQNNYQWFLALLIQVFIAYHVFYLSKRLSTREKLLDKEKIREPLDRYVDQIESKQGNRKMVMINSKMVGKRGEKNSEYYAEIKTTCYEGVELFDSIQENKQGDKIFVVVLLPYEKIEYVDLRGDDSDWLPQIICTFDGIKSTPFTEIRYYKESDVFYEGNDPPDFRYSRVYETPKFKHE